VRGGSTSVGSLAVSFMVPALVRFGLLAGVRYLTELAAGSDDLSMT